MNENERGQWTSASNAEADSLCVARHQMQKGIPEPPVSRDADAGSRIHHALFSGKTDILSEAEYSTYEKCVLIEAELVKRFFGEFTGEVVRERRLWFNRHVEAIHSGQPDVVYTNPSRSLILEYKAGWYEVSQSPRNKQLRDQVALKFINSPDLDCIACAVIQPHITMSPEICAYGVDDLNQAIREMAIRVAASNDPSNRDKRTAGEVQCKFCRAKNNCPEYGVWAGGNLPAVRSITELPLAQWGPDEMKLFLQQHKRARDWLDDCYAYIKEHIRQQPGSVPGAVIKPGKVIRPVDPDKIQQLFERFEKHCQGTLDRFMRCLEVSKGKFEKSVGECMTIKGKTLDNVMDVLYKDLTLEKQQDGSIVLQKEKSNEDAKGTVRIAG